MFCCCHKILRQSSYQLSRHTFYANFMHLVSDLMFLPPWSHCPPPLHPSPPPIPGLSCSSSPGSEAAGTGWTAAAPDCWTSTPPGGEALISSPAGWEVWGLQCHSHWAWRRRWDGGVWGQRWSLEETLEKMKEVDLHLRLSCRQVCGVFLQDDKSQRLIHNKHGSQQQASNQPTNQQAETLHQGPQ